MQRQDIIDTTTEFLVDEFEVNPDSIQPQANMHETLELDSLDYVDLVVVIERHFGFKATTQDFKSITTFDDFYDLVEQRTAALANKE